MQNTERDLKQYGKAVTSMNTLTTEWAVLRGVCVHVKTEENAVLDPLQFAYSQDHGTEQS